MSEKLTASAKASALRLLSYRPRSTSEIKNRLSDKFDHETVEITIDWLIENEMVNDEKFANWWTESRIRQKILGSSMIRKELFDKGISSSIVDKALVNVDDNLNAHHLAERMCRSIGTTEIKQFKRKLYGKLMRRGFSSGVALGSIDKAWNSLNQNNEISL